MFSGHTVTLTMLNFFITECTYIRWNFDPPSFSYIIIKLRNVIQTLRGESTSCIPLPGFVISLESFSSWPDVSTTRSTSLSPSTLRHASSSITTLWPTAAHLGKHYKPLFPHECFITNNLIEPRIVTEPAYGSRSSASLKPALMGWCPTSMRCPGKPSHALPSRMPSAHCAKFSNAH